MSAALKALTIQSGVTQRVGSTASLEVGAGINSTAATGLGLTIETGTVTENIVIGATTTTGSITIGGTAMLAGAVINIGVGMSGVGAINIGTGLDDATIIRIGTDNITAPNSYVEFPGVVNFTSVSAAPDVSFLGNVTIGDAITDNLAINSQITTNLTFDAAGPHSVLQKTVAGAGQNLTFAGGGSSGAGGGQAIVVGGAGAAGVGGQASITGGLGSTTGGATLVTGGAGTAAAGGAVNITSGNGATATGSVTLGVGTGGTGTITIGGTNATTTTIGLSSASSLLDLLSIIITPTVHFLKEVGHTLQVDPSTTATAAGGAFSVLAGTGNTTGSGGAANFTAGSSSATVGSIPGATIISGGRSFSNQPGGLATIQGGKANNDGGEVQVLGSAAAVGGYTGGAVTIHAGGSSGALTGGGVDILAGGGGATGNGGTTAVTAGPGGATSGNGGPLNLTGGAAPTEGNGGPITIAGGAAASATSKNGGNVVVNGGALGGAGTNGLVLIGQSNTSAISLYANTTAQPGVVIGATGTGTINLPISGLDGSTVFFRMGNVAVAGGFITAGFFSALFDGSDVSLLGAGLPNGLHTHSSIAATITISLTAGETIAQGAPVYAQATTGQGFNINEINNGAGARGARARNGLGLAAAPTTATNPLTIIIAGEVTIAAALFVDNANAAYQPVVGDIGNVVWGAAKTGSNGLLTMDVLNFVNGDLVQKFGILVATDGANANVVNVQVGDCVLL